MTLEVDLDELCRTSRLRTEVLIKMIEDEVQRRVREEKAKAIAAATSVIEEMFANLAIVRLRDAGSQIVRLKITMGKDEEVAP